MQDNSDRPTELVQNEEARLTITSGKKAPRRGVTASIAGALILLTWDAAITGSFIFSYLICPIWFLVSVLKNAIQRPGWKIALLRIAIPAVTLGLVRANEAVQYRIGEANAPRIIAACEEFHAANGRFPKTLDELVPQYMPSVPRAKYSLLYGEFEYFNYGEPMLVWCVVPPFGRKIYTFDDRRWSYLD
jgi:hypothetical protein